MSEQRALLCDTAEAVFAEAAVEGMAPIEGAGFGQLLVPEAEGGFGGDWGDVFAVLRLSGAKVPHLPVGELIVGGEISRPLGAFIRVAQAAGALDAALAMSIEYVNTRQQFGKALGKFQAVQQVLAIFAVEAAAVNVAGAAAAAALAQAAGKVD
ncbi:MAG: acyl-CoA dehydrogenase family protein [Sphingorhabdus sp.]